MIRSRFFMAIVLALAALSLSRAVASDEDDARDCNGDTKKPDAERLAACERVKPKICLQGKDAIPVVTDASCANLKAIEAQLAAKKDDPKPADPKPDVKSPGNAREEGQECVDGDMAACEERCKLGKASSCLAVDCSKGKQDACKKVCDIAPESKVCQQAKPDQDEEGKGCVDGDMAVCEERCKMGKPSSCLVVDCSKGKQDACKKVCDIAPESKICKKNPPGKALTVETQRVCTPNTGTKPLPQILCSGSGPGQLLNPSSDAETKKQQLAAEGFACAPQNLATCSAYSGPHGDVPVDHLRCGKNTGKVFSFACQDCVCPLGFKELGSTRCGCPGSLKQVSTPGGYACVNDPKDQDEVKEAQTKASVTGLANFKYVTKADCDNIKSPDESGDQYAKHYWSAATPAAGAPKPVKSNGSAKVAE